MQKKITGSFLKYIGVWSLLICLIAVIMWFYYYSTISANSFWLDQYKLIEFSREILDGELRLVGMRTSRLNFNFPMIHYLLTPVIAITASPWGIYVSAAVAYMIGILIMGLTLLKLRPFSELLIFVSLSLTHVWSLYYSSFPWPPNYIPLFLSLFFICFFKYLKNSKNVWFFHAASVFLNIIFQLHTMSVVLIIGFVSALIILGKLPRYRHWFFQVWIQLILVCPWIIYHIFFIDWANEPKYHSSLFKDFLSPAEALINYLSGFGLTREHTLYLGYGTNTFPYENFWFNWLSVGGVLILLILLWTLKQIHSLQKGRVISWKVIHLHLLPYSQEEKDFNKSYPIALYCMFMPTLFYIFSGIVMFPHYFQFLTPLLFLMVAVLPGQLESKTFRKIAYYGVIMFIINQGIFSYWRSWEEYNSPYLDDIGYTKVLAYKIAKECRDKPQIRFLSRREIKNADEMFHYRFDPQLESLNRTGTEDCHSIMVFQNKLLLQSPIVSWYLQKLEPLKKMEVYNNQIWITGKQ